MTDVEKQIVPTTMLNYSEVLLYSQVWTSCLVEEQAIICEFVALEDPVLSSQWPQIFLNGSDWKCLMTSISVTVFFFFLN